MKSRVIEAAIYSKSVVASQCGSLQNAHRKSLCRRGAILEMRARDQKGLDSSKIAATQMINGFQILPAIAFEYDSDLFPVWLPAKRLKASQTPQPDARCAVAPCAPKRIRSLSIRISQVRPITPL